MAPVLPPLYAIVDPLDSGRSPEALAAAFLAGGARLLQVRLKHLTPRAVLAETRRVLRLARGVGARVVVNDRPDVAAAAGADGVHLGQDDVPVAVARAVLPRGAWVGVSTHDVVQARTAEADGADYIAVGPIFATATKADALAPRGTALVTAVRAAVRRPVVAIGGITPERCREVFAAGADAVAVIGALVRADDPAAAVRAFLRRAPSLTRPRAL